MATRKGGKCMKRFVAYLIVCMLAVTMTCGTHTIRNGIWQWLKGETSMTSNYTHHQYQYPSEPVYAYAEWKDANTLQMTWRFPELAFVDTLVLTFNEDGSQFGMVRSVNVNSGPLVCDEVTFTK